MTEQEFLNWAFVKPQTHTKKECSCPECGVTFDRWLQNHLVADWADNDSRQHDTLCSGCFDENEEESEEEESFPC